MNPLQIAAVTAAVGVLSAGTYYGMNAFGKKVRFKDAVVGIGATVGGIIALQNYAFPSCDATMKTVTPNAFPSEREASCQKVSFVAPIAILGIASLLGVVRKETLVPAVVGTAGTAAAVGLFAAAMSSVRF